VIPDYLSRVFTSSMGCSYRELLQTTIAKLEGDLEPMCLALDSSGVNILHLGGAHRLRMSKILMGRPDVLLLPVGGGSKAHTSRSSAGNSKP